MEHIKKDEFCFFFSWALRDFKLFTPWDFGYKPQHTDKDSLIFTHRQRDEHRVKKQKSPCVGPDSSQSHWTFDWVVRPASLRGDPDK